MEEVASLARAYIAAHGQTRPTADPSAAGHGIATIGDVADEALCILSEDVVLKLRQPAIVDLLRKSLTRVRVGMDEMTEEEVAFLFSLNATLRRTYLSDALAAIAWLTAEEPRRLADLDRCVGTLVTDLRARGWSDPTLRRLFSSLSHGDFKTEFAEIRTKVLSPFPSYSCYVAVSVDGLTGQDDALRALGIRELDFEPPRKAPQKGSFIKATVVGPDPQFAARKAYHDAASAIGAVAVFVGKVHVRSPVVVVTSDTIAPLAVRVTPPLPHERRRAQPAEVLRIIASANATVISSIDDGVFDAIRHRRRAMETDDLESRFILLWFGIERLSLGTRDHSTLLSAVASMVPRAITLGKLRRELTSLAAAIGRVNYDAASEKTLREIVGTGPYRVDRRRLLESLMKPESDSRKLTALFYDQEPRLVQWYWGLRRMFGIGKGARIAEYLESSCLRLGWQVKRLYRARNSVAHAAHGPAWLEDLIGHAHFYLTQLVAICIRRREQDPLRPPHEILVERCAQYDAFVDLLRREHRHAVDPAALLRPTRLFSGG